MVFAAGEPARRSQASRNPIHAGLQFRGFTGSQLLRPARLLASPCRIRPGLLPATGGFYFQASAVLVALPAAGYDYDIDWTPMSAGLAPAGTAASFAALARMESSRVKDARLPNPGWRAVTPDWADRRRFRATGPLHPGYGKGLHR